MVIKILTKISLLGPLSQYLLHVKILTLHVDWNNETVSVTVKMKLCMYFLGIWYSSFFISPSLNKLKLELKLRYKEIDRYFLLLVPFLYLVISYFSCLISSLLNTSLRQCLFRPFLQSFISLWKTPSDFKVAWSNSTKRSVSKRKSEEPDAHTQI